MSPNVPCCARKKRTDVRQAVLRIPPQYRLILVLHDMEELPTEEVARITGLTENTIRVRLHRARLFVRKELGPTQERTVQGARKTPRKTMAEIAHRVAAKCSLLFRTISTKSSMIRSVPNWKSICPGVCPARLSSRICELTIREIKTYKSESLDRHAAAAIRRIVLQKYEAALEALSSSATARQ